MVTKYIRELVTGDKSHVDGSTETINKFIEFITTSLIDTLNKTLSSILELKEISVVSSKEISRTPEKVGNIMSIQNSISKDVGGSIVVSEKCMESHIDEAMKEIRSGFKEIERLFIHPK